MNLNRSWTQQWRLYPWIISWSRTGRSAAHLETYQFWDWTSHIVTWKHGWKHMMERTRHVIPEIGRRKHSNPILNWWIRRTELHCHPICILTLQYSWILFLLNGWNVDKKLNQLPSRINWSKDFFPQMEKVITWQLQKVYLQPKNGRWDFYVSLMMESKLCLLNSNSWKRLISMWSNHFKCCKN